MHIEKVSTSARLAVYGQLKKNINIKYRRGRAKHEMYKSENIKTQRARIFFSLILLVYVLRSVRRISIASKMAYRSILLETK